MNCFAKEDNRLRIIQNYLSDKAPYFGVNKRQEILRLIYEISKKEDLPPLELSGQIDDWHYAKLKGSLLKRRYAETYGTQTKFGVYLPAIELKAATCAPVRKKLFYPKKVFFEKKASGSYLLKRFKDFFPKAVFSEIGTLKEHINRSPRVKPCDYNNRRDSVYIVWEKFDFFKSCPCTKKAVRCNYHIFNLGFGCIFDCTYCYLQGYANNPGILFPANLDTFFSNYYKYKNSRMLIGSGEFTDSLMLDGITDYSSSLIEFFSKQKNATFEFKTKSPSIGNILKAKPAKNIVVSWSLNPDSIIKENEFFTASLTERIDAAAECAGRGFKVSFHFDPLIYFDGWRKDYTKLLDMLFMRISTKDILRISLGTLRFRPDLKKIIESRFPQNKILNEELILDFDGKLRYPFKIRLAMYNFLAKKIRAHDKKINLYLCMEEPRMRRQLNA